MKRRLFTLAVIVFFFIMLLFPGPVFRGASQGILLWFQTVLPTLLPFMIAANLMVRTNAVHCISRLAGGLLGRALKVSDCGAFAVIAGFLCGYPMGAKVTADLLREGKICWRRLPIFCPFATTQALCSSSAMWSCRTSVSRLCLSLRWPSSFSPLSCAAASFTGYSGGDGRRAWTGGENSKALPAPGARPSPSTCWTPVLWTALTPSQGWEGTLCIFPTSRSWISCTRWPEVPCQCASDLFWRSRRAFPCWLLSRYPSLCGGYWSWPSPPSEASARPPRPTA